MEPEQPTDEPERASLVPMARTPGSIDIDVTLRVDTTEFDAAMDNLHRAVSATFARRFAPTWESMEASDIILLTSARGWRKRVVQLRLWRLRCNRWLAVRCW